MPMRQVLGIGFCMVDSGKLIILQETEQVSFAAIFFLQIGEFAITVKQISPTSAKEMRSDGCSWMRFTEQIKWLSFKIIFQIEEV